MTAGPEKRLFGSEFGMNRRSGWYSASRYLGSRDRQFKPHKGSASYWFFKTQEREQPAVDAAAREITDRVLARWSA